ncbi:NAD-P-binding protein [Thamnocephalis sphaerospora]|uniref:NAD-P-binding protein n=1 Tax=Thamnocephalis sphaerospora TaxID=78915 RepID=A0A4P9XTA9_9FUNG|nr:NAD-P-binding protein [Thamnocephalis sphaerospora]|eukprot:RKP09395.1 NAD-P-binding protein [Thamnocephalis sphaerospora]
MTQPIRAFMHQPRFAVVGASSARQKFGNRVLRWYQDHNLPVTPVHPRETEIEGLPCVTSLEGLSDPTHTAVSVITPPSVTLTVLQQAKALGVPYVWLQPGAENAECVQYAEEQGLQLIYGGPCILVQGEQARL